MTRRKVCVEKNVERLHIGSMIISRGPVREDRRATLGAPRCGPRPPSAQHFHTVSCRRLDWPRLQPVRDHK